MATQAAQKKGRKRWYNVLASSQFKGKPLGETISYEPEKLVGRVVKTNLSNLIGNIRMQNVKVSFKITEVKNSDANTEVVGYEVAPSHIKRIVRAGRDKVDVSLVKKTKDDVTVKVKPVVLTRFNTHNSVRTGLRKKCEEFFDNSFKNLKYSEFISDLMSNRIQTDMKKFLNKTYPTSGVEIRVMKKIEK